MASPTGLISGSSEETFPAVDVHGELNPTRVDDFPIDAVSFHVSTVKDAKEEEEAQKKDSGSNLMSTFMISGVAVALIGVAAFVVSRKLREQ
ncbi:uncharacterized protein LOC116267188 [Nymphaea colorata]|nr:uncharacterized protein LOC116267188 [Nymphaea colorata]